VFCKPDKSLHNDDLGLEEEKKLLKDALYFRKNGFKRIDVSGSEPLKYSKIIEFLSWLSKSFDDISLLDPGNRLADKSFASRFAKTGISRVFIPIYGSEAKYHDAAVGNPGAFNQVVKGIKNLLELDSGIEIRLTSVFLKQNIENFYDMFVFCRKEFGIYPWRLTMPYLHNDNKNIRFQDFLVSFSDIRRAVLKISRLDAEDIRIEYVPLCIFSEEDLLGFNSIRFFNVFYLYNLSDDEINKRIKDIVKDYRNQEYLWQCEKCFLKKDGICGGILREHLLNNKDYHFNPLSEDLYNRVKKNIAFSKVNPGVSK
jgi:MoaA/NifB/PqqE/SkfB family radical SAM enzyme